MNDPCDEVEYPPSVRSVSENGEVSTASWARDARKAYNKAHRKSSRVQLSRYQAPVEEPTQQELDQEYYIWEDLRTQADMWYEEKLRDNSHYR